MDNLNPVSPVPKPDDRHTYRNVQRARAMIKHEKRRARSSITHYRVRPRTRAQEIVDELRLNAGRDFCLTITEIYFVRCRSYVKIGRSTCVAGRVRELQNANPEPLELLGTFIGISCDEPFLHNILGAEPEIERIRKEWLTDHPLIHEVLALLQKKPEARHVRRRTWGLK